MQEKDTQNQNESSTSEVYTVIRGTWLSRAPNGNAFLVAMASWVVLALSCLLYWRDALGAQTWMPASRALVAGAGCGVRPGFVRGGICCRMHAAWAVPRRDAGVEDSQ